jgi:hypothetical protein
MHVFNIITLKNQDGLHAIDAILSFFGGQEHITTMGIL